jgi:hypothetical protein
VLVAGKPPPRESSSSSSAAALQCLLSSGVCVIHCLEWGGSLRALLQARGGEEEGTSATEVQVQSIFQLQERANKMMVYSSCLSAGAEECSSSSNRNNPYHSLTSLMVPTSFSSTSTTPTAANMVPGTAASASSSSVVVIPASHFHGGGATEANSLKRVLERKGRVRATATEAVRTHDSPLPAVAAAAASSPSPSPSYSTSTSAPLRWSTPVFVATAATTGRAPPGSVPVLSSRSAVVREGDVLTLNRRTGAVYFGAVEL